MASATKQYIGDGVYVDFDGYHVVLTAENGLLAITNQIYLEPEVLRELASYVDRLKREKVLNG
jgi:hypothetical protein